jgi:hypothetical protein
MADLIDLFNDMLASLPNQPGLGHVRYIDLRTLLSNTLEGRAYRQSSSTGSGQTDAGVHEHAFEIRRICQELVASRAVSTRLARHPSSLSRKIERHGSRTFGMPCGPIGSGSFAECLANSCVKQECW